MKIGSFGVVRRIAATANQEPDYFEFCDETFRITDEDPTALPFLELADAIENGVDSNDTQGMAAMYRMLRGCIHPDDWARFRKTAMDNSAAPEDLLPIVGAVWEAVTGRPSRRPSGSPDGPSTTGTDSRDGSSSPVMGQDLPSRPMSAIPATPSAVADPVERVPAAPAPPATGGVTVVSLPPGWPMPPPERQDILRPQVLVGEGLGR